MSTISSSYLTSTLASYLGTTANAGQTSTTNNATSNTTSAGTSAAADAATNVTLSDAAQALLAAAGDTSTTGVTPAATARNWLDEQYKKLGTTSPTPKDKPALELTPLNRASLAAIVQNTGKTFSADEQAAAATELDKRFATAMTAHIAIARATGNYAGLYQAAADYLDQAGTDERASKTWQDDRKGVTDGLAAAKATKGQAPETDPAKDPIRNMLNRRTASAASASASAESVVTNARAMLDDQANHASDAGTNLVFGAREDGQLVDFSKFTNRALAAISVNKDEKFSGEEARAAKNELNLRTRTTMMGILSPTSGSASGGDMNLGLIRTYEDMSEEEKTALGVTDAVTDRLIQNFQTLQSLQSAFAGGSSSGGLAGGMMGLSAAMAAYNNANNASDDDQTSLMGLAGLL